MEEAIIGSTIEIFKPVLESATILAAQYATACGRDIVMAEDMQMGMMYAARNVIGKQVGSLFPEIYEEEESGTDSDSDGSWETVDDEELVWARYSGTDDMANKMNECADTWDEWSPDTPAEVALKAAIDKQREQ